MNVKKNDALLGMSKSDAYRRFGVPDICLNSILVYCQEDRVMILIMGASNQDGTPVESTRSYIFGTLDGEILDSSNVSFPDPDSIPRPGDPLTNSLKQYIAADIGSTFYRPVMFANDLTMWQLVVNGKTVQEAVRITIRELLSKKSGIPSITRGEADAIYDRLIQEP